MKLLGLGKAEFFKQKSRSGACEKTGAGKTAPLLTLPYELIEKIVAHLVLDDVPPSKSNKNSKALRYLYRDLFAISRTCKVLRNAVPDDALYRTVILNDKAQALKFYKSILKPHVHHIIKHIRTVCVNRPMDDSPSNVSLGNAGFSYSTRSSTSKPWDELLLKIIGLIPYLQFVILDQLPTSFSLASSSTETSRAFQLVLQRPGPVGVSLIPESGWTLTLAPSALWPLGNINHLHLSNVIINDSSLSRPLVSRITTLELTGCRIRCSPNRLAEYFSYVTSLTLDNLREDSEIAWARCFPRLHHLTLGLVGRVPRNNEFVPSRLIPAEYNYAYSSDNDEDASETVSLANSANILEYELPRIAELAELTVYAPPTCIIPRDRPQYRQEYDIFAHIYQLHHLRALNAIIVCGEESKAAIWRTATHWTTFLERRAIPDNVDFTVKSYYDDRTLYHRPCPVPAS